MADSQVMSTPAGDVQVHIAESSDPNETFDVIEVSDIEYKFDINDITKDEINSVPFIIASCSITVDDTSSSATGSFEADYLRGGDQNVEIDVGSYTFPVRYQLGEYTADDIADTVTFQVTASDEYDTTTSATFSSVHDNADGGSHQASPIKQVIESNLEEFGETSFVIDTPNFSDDTMPPSAAAGTIWAASEEPFSVIQDCAAMEGAYFGTGFNNGFYVQRDQTTNKATITQDDILGTPSRDISYPDLKDIEINADSADSAFTAGFDVTDTDTVAQFRRQSLVVTRNTALVRVLYDNTDGRLETDSDSNMNTAALSATNDGILAYKDVLRGSAPFTISITVWGFDTVKPWQPFDITDTSGKLHEYTGKTYRPTELRYSIMNTIEIIAYAL